MAECPLYIPEDYRKHVIVSKSFNELLETGSLPEGKTLALFPDPKIVALRQSFDQLALKLLTDVPVLDLKKMENALKGKGKDIWDRDAINTHKPAIEFMYEDLVAANTHNYYNARIDLMHSHMDVLGSDERLNIAYFHLDDNSGRPRQTKLLRNYSDPTTQGARAEEVMFNHRGGDGLEKRNRYILRPDKTGFSLGHDAFVFAATGLKKTGFMHACPLMKKTDPPRFLLSAWG